MKLPLTEWSCAVNILHVTQELQKKVTTICKVVVVVLFFYVHGKQLRSCLDGQLT